ncbi:MAG: 3'-5' exonuclease, partial [Nitrospiraceae bacterium]
MIIFYDLETTGLPKAGNDPLRQPGIVQIGACRVDTKLWSDTLNDKGDIMVRASDGIVEEFNMFVNPELLPDRFEPGAVKVNGITWNDAQDKPSFFTVGEDFAKFCVGAEVMSGYNHINFDNKILMWQLLR